MEEMLDTHRILYNNALAERKDVYESSGVSLRYGDQSASYKENRKSNEYYQRTNFSSCQATLKRLDRAYQAFFRRVKAGQTPGYPRFRGRGRFDSVEFPSYGDGGKMRDSGRAYFQHIGEIKVKLHRPWEGVIKTMRLKRKVNKWYLVLSCDLGACTPAKRSVRTGVGIDLGLKTFATASDGTEFGSETFFRDHEAKLRRLQRRVSRRNKGSNRWKKACIDVAKHHVKIANRRRNWHFNTAGKIISGYDLIAVEDLNISGLARTRMAKSVVDAAWGQFVNILEFKAECAGATVVKVNPAYTTQMCSACESIEGPKGQAGLGEREWTCSCGVEHDRDVNAAKNILRLGWSLHAEIRRVAA